MKFTDVQKKWALTGSLATLLSFNLALSLSGYNIGSTSLASEQQPTFGEVKLDGKTFKVMFEKTGDVTTASIASGSCYSCGERINLPIQFSENIEDMKIALAVAKATASKQNATEEKAVTVALSRREKEAAKNEKTEDSVDEGKEALNKSAKECKEKHKKSADRLDCNSDGLIRLLANDKIEYNKQDVFKHFVTHIATPLMELIKAGPESANYDLAKSIIEHLASSIPEDYNYLRQSLAKVNAKIVADAERNVQAKFNEFKQIDKLAKANPGDMGLRERANDIANSVNGMQIQTEKIAADLGVNLRNGYAEAVTNDYVTSTIADQYLKTDYFGTINPIIQGLKQSSLAYMAGNVNGSNYQIPVIEIGEGSTISISEGGLISIQPANTIVGANRGQGQLTTATNAWNGPRSNQITAQNVIVPGQTAMISGQGGQNSARIVVISTGQPQPVYQSNQNRGQRPPVMAPRRY